MEHHMEHDRGIRVAGIGRHGRAAIGVATGVLAANGAWKGRRRSISIS